MKKFFTDDKCYIYVGETDKGNSSIFLQIPEQSVKYVTGFIKVIKEHLTTDKSSDKEKMYYCLDYHVRNKYICYIYEDEFRRVFGENVDNIDEIIFSFYKDLKLVKFTYDQHFAEIWTQNLISTIYSIPNKSNKVHILYISEFLSRYYNKIFKAFEFDTNRVRSVQAYTKVMLDSDVHRLTSESFKELMSSKDGRELLLTNKEDGFNLIMSESLTAYLLLRYAPVFVFPMWFDPLLNKALEIARNALLKHEKEDTTSTFKSELFFVLPLIDSFMNDFIDSIEGNGYCSATLSFIENYNIN